MRLSVIIPSKNRPDEIINCVESIYAHSPQVDEVIVVDQSATAYELPAHPRLKHVYRPDLSGLTAARNTGIDASSGDAVLFMDDDCLFVNDVVAVMSAFLDEHPDAIGAQAKIADAEYVPRPLSSRIFEHGFFDVYTLGPYDNLRRTAGFGCVFRRSLFDHERYDDDQLEGYCYGEDYDLSARARRWGRLMYAPAAVVEHRASRVNRFDRRRFFETRWRNINYLFAKHRPRRSLQDRLAHLWWRTGETVQWLRFGYGLPRLPR